MKERGGLKREYVYPKKKRNFVCMTYKRDDRGGERAYLSKKREGKYQPLATQKDKLGKKTQGRVGVFVASN